MRDATLQMSRVLDTVPLESGEELGWARLDACRWRHGELHRRTPAMGEHVVMAYLRDGGAITRRCGRRVDTGTMRAGSLTIIPSGQEAHWDLDGPVEIVHAYIQPGMLQAFAEEHGVAVGPLRERLTYDDVSGARILELLARELLQRGPRDRLFSEQVCSLLCMRLLRCHSDDVRRLEGPIRGGLAPWQIARIEELVVSTLHRDQSLGRLAAAVGLSPFHFARMFKVATGLPPHSWVMGKRLARARELLSQTDLTVGEVAAAVGYDDPSYFARLFRRSIGATPVQYRRERRVSRLMRS